MLHQRVLIVVALILSALPGASAAAATRIVNPADAGAFATIQSAINAANPGDQILVHPGTYVERINYLGKVLDIRSLQGPGVTTINGTGAGIVPTVRCVNREGVGTRLIGFTVTGGSSGGMALLDFARVEVRDCVVRGNTANSFAGGGINVENNSHLTAVNCVITDNVAAVGGGIGLIVASADIINCTIVNNTATSDPPFTGGGLFGLDSFFHLRNCIFFDNVGQEPGQQAQLDTPMQFAFSTINHCCIEGWDNSLGGVGNFGANPLFKDAAGLDFQLSAGSPCIDAGDNASVPAGVTLDLAGEARFLDDPDTPDTGAGPPPVVDLGAFERVPTPVDGDVNCDGQLDLRDGQTLIDILLGADTTDCHLEAADLDGSGATDGRDIQSLTDLLIGL